MHNVVRYIIVCGCMRTDVTTDVPITVRPLYGPVAGGTRVTITGARLTKSNVTAVLFGQYKSFLVTQRYHFMLHYVA